nr:hypothetical protein CFP56_57916 [Quercus suber]
MQLADISRNEKMLDLSKPLFPWLIYAVPCLHPTVNSATSSLTAVYMFTYPTSPDGRRNEDRASSTRFRANEIFASIECTFHASTSDVSGISLTSRGLARLQWDSVQSSEVACCILGERRRRTAKSEAGGGGFCLEARNGERLDKVLCLIIYLSLEERVCYPHFHLGEESPAFSMFCA